MTRIAPLCIAGILVMAGPVFAQNSVTARNLPPGWVDGSKTPSQVPDRAAYRLVFIRLKLPDSPDQDAVSRQGRRLTRIGLSASDTTILKQALATFAGNYSAWARNPRGGATDDQAWAIVQATQTLLRAQLSNDGNVKFAAYVALEKTHMIVRP
jgi:hypothetical protein